MRDIAAVMARRLRCPRCSRRFRPQDISALETGPRFGVYRLRCPMCTSQRLVIAVWNKTAVRTYTTDLDAEEWMFYRQAPAINADDVLRIHQMLVAYEGDFSDVLEDPILEDHESP
ncbi:MAG TPA: hypothetical protein VFD70_22820 [Anaerolineae bacterium]|nr:hypothetical protein [Anaerolineae bacterium]